MGRIQHVIADRRTKNGILYVSGHRIISYTNKGEQPRVIVGNGSGDQRDRYREGTGEEAVFSIIGSVVQVQIGNEWRLIAADVHNHCLRWVFLTNSSTALLAGDRTVSQGCVERDAQLDYDYHNLVLHNLLCKPEQVVVDWKNETYRRVYVSQPEINRLTMMKINKNNKVFFSRRFDFITNYWPYGMAVDPISKRLFTGSAEHIHTLQLGNEDYGSNTWTPLKFGENISNRLKGLITQTISKLIYIDSDYLILLGAILFELNLGTGKLTPLCVSGIGVTTEHPCQFDAPVCLDKYNSTTLLIANRSVIHLIPSK